MKRRLKHKHWKPLLSVERTVPGREPKQQAPSAKPCQPLSEEDYQEDSIYHLFECGRVMAEMVRPNVKGANWGGYADRGCLQIAGLARAIQIKLRYPHVCTPQYCRQAVGKSRGVYYPVRTHDLQALFACGPVQHSSGEWTAVVLKTEVRVGSSFHGARLRCARCSAPCRDT